jgi:DMSO/TMAO reductase YedYZ molybdopterin-dependent catalytic subunit/ABC-type Co2+ transport system permease subunit
MVASAATIQPGEEAGVWSKRAGALTGALSALVALAAAELISLVLPGEPSPVRAIADIIIDTTPAGIREPLIRAVGTADKPILTVGIILVIFGAGALVGARYRNIAQKSWPVYLILGLLIAALTAAATAAVFASLVTGLAGALAGWATLAFLLQTTSSPIETASGELAVSVRPTLDRRTFLVSSGAVGVLAVAGVAVLSGVRATTQRSVEIARALLKLPAPSRLAAPVPASAGIDLPGMPAPITPNDDFYRIDTALVAPAVDVDNWTLTITGRVQRPITLTYGDIMEMPQVERHITLACVSNPVGGDLVGNALWQGVLLRTVLENAGIGSGGEQLVAESVDGFTAAVPVQVAMDDRDALIAVGMNGEVLPINHGFPARLVVPGLYGYVSATKWLREIRLTTFAEESGFWIPRGWIADGTIEAASRIDVPTNRASIPVGNVVVAGRAWHQRVPIGGVEVAVDEETWRPATLATDMGIDTWRLWSWNWAATPGEHSLRVRMIDANGDVQSPAVRRPGPGPSSGYQSVDVFVT